MRKDGDILPVPGARHVCDRTFVPIEATGCVATVVVENEVKVAIKVSVG
jgi:hypothetical protein